VIVGLTLVELVADVEVKEPGLIATLVDPVVDQASVLLVPAVIVAGLEVKEPMVGFGGGAAFTVMVTVSVVEPEELVAVSV
jgi:hypothetical protein